jgi:hypothetical protein
MDYYQKYFKYKMKYISLKGGGAPPIELNNTLDFFTKRLNDHVINLNFKLNDFINEIKNTQEPINTYNNIMGQIKRKIEEPSSNDIIKRWACREYITSVTFETAHRIFTLYNGTNLKICKETRNISGDTAYFSILGSTTLLSDIDVTVQAPNASLWIAVIEDLWEQTNWFDHSVWQVDLYGDFTMIGEYYIDTRFFSKYIMIILLKLAVVSYFKHDNSHNFNNEILNKLINWCIINAGLLITLEEVITFGKNKAATLKTTSREIYYQKLGESEELQKQIRDSLYSTKLDKHKTNDLLGKVMISLSEANLYREENYILPSTVIHVVKCEQARETGNSCAPIILKSACCSLSSFVYTLSAIEQLGYLLHNLEKDKSICNLSAGKYFGRLVRAFTKTSLGSSEKMKNLLDLANILSILKKDRGDTGNSNKTCPDESTDLYKLILELFVES